MHVIDVGTRCRLVLELLLEPMKAAIILSRVIKVGHECSLRPIFWIPVAVMRWIGVGKAMLKHVLGSCVANYLVRNLYS